MTAMKQPHQCRAMNDVESPNGRYKEVKCTNEILPGSDWCDDHQLTREEFLKSLPKAVIQHFDGRSSSWGDVPENMEHILIDPAIFEAVFWSIAGETRYQMCGESVIGTEVDLNGGDLERDRMLGFSTIEDFRRAVMLFDACVIKAIVYDINNARQHIYPEWMVSKDLFSHMLFESDQDRADAEAWHLWRERRRAHEMAFLERGRVASKVEFCQP